ncbi:MAG: AMP-binding protein [Kofleriaceae bacterium]
MRIVASRITRVRWQLASTGAARGHTDREALILELRSDTGHVGLGEAAPLDNRGQALLQPCYTDLAALVACPAARFALETALYDLIARERGVTIAELLGPVHPMPPIAVVVDDPDEARAAGARCLKIKVGGDDDEARVRAIAAAAPDARLRLDANQRWPRESVRARLAALADLPIDFVEEPCSDAASLLPLPLPIALDESLITLAELPRGIAAVVLKPTELGGFHACLELAARARAAGIAAVVTHALEGPIGTHACGELARVLGGDVAVGLAPHPALAAFEPETIVATPSHTTVEAVQRALAAYRPIALVHHALPATEQARQRAAVEAATLPYDAAAVLFTSGSTGTPRGVVLSRSALAAAAAASEAQLGWRADDRWLVALSLAHAGGLAVVVRCYLAGKPIELVEDQAQLAAALARCTLASLVPTQLAALLDDPAWRPPPQLRALLLGGAAASPALLAAAAARRVPFLVTYGMTESFGQLATAPLDHAGDPSAPLVPLPGVDLAGGTRDAPAPIRVRAPMLATCYLDGTPIAPALVTRDLGYLTSELHIVGRADDTIITGGENVHPATVEAVLAATPGVRAAIAFAIADPRWGQIVGAAIAVDAAFDPASIHTWHTALPAHARPRELAIVAALPTLATGKLDRHAAALLPREPLRY